MLKIQTFQLTEPEKDHGPGPDSEPSRPAERRSAPKTLTVTRTCRSASRCSRGLVITSTLKARSPVTLPQLQPTTAWAEAPNCMLVEVIAKYWVRSSSTPETGFQCTLTRAGSIIPAGM